MKVLLILSVLICLAGCSRKPENHEVFENGNETGVEIVVSLKNGGTAVLICPKFNHKPVGIHGRECYLRSYDKIVATR